ncbi:DUF58 domain-containing protein [Mumia zhuanghuii]|uniref:DUF58 domain-containing protein n=1 Tax=Mumia zhuanghuii TaxID=2585211 RepID=UPI001891CAA6|nr:DUF58 domain-containing protein [Mumia zhuanghuii]
MRSSPRSACPSPDGDVRATLDALTSRGRAFVAAGLTVLLGGILLGLDVLVRIGMLALALPLVAVVVVARGRSTVSASREVTPPRVPAGAEVAVALRIDGGGRGTPGTVLLEDELPDALGGRRRFSVESRGPEWRCLVEYAVTPHRRGFHAIGPLTVRVGDPFGFLSVARTFHTTTPLVVTPVVHSLGRMWAGGVGAERGDHRVRLGATGRPDDASVREYRVGDDLRRIHWRTTARTGELMVRREEEGRHADLTVFLDTRRDVHQPGKEGTFEWAVSAAASVAAHFAGNGWDVRLTTDTTDSHDSAPDELGLILDELAAVRTSSRRTTGLVPADVLGSRGTVVAIVTGADAGALDHLDRCCSGAGRRLALVLDADGWLSRASSGTGASADLAASARSRGWDAVAVGGGQGVADAWRALAALAAKAAVR